MRFRVCLLRTRDSGTVTWRTALGTVPNVDVSTRWLTVKRRSQLSSPVRRMFCPCAHPTLVNELPRREGTDEHDQASIHSEPRQA